MTGLIGCERSGVVRSAFRRAGHDVYSNDLEEADDGSPYHLIGDVLDIANSPVWDFVILHPPCTYLSNSGAKHLYVDGRRSNGRYEPRWDKMYEAARLFTALLALPVPLICVENPIQHCHARALIPKYQQIIQPWEYGHGEIKATCLWLRGLPLLTPTRVVAGRIPRVHHESPGTKNGLSRSDRRSVTYPGIAEAMAAQWGRL